MTTDRLVTSRAPGSAAGTGGLAIALALVLAGLWLHTSPLNSTLFRALNVWGPDAPMLWSALSVAGLGVSVLLLLAALGPGAARELALMVLVLLVGGLIVQIIKSSIDSPRPLAALGEWVVHVVGDGVTRRSMPSGHSAASFALASILFFSPRAGGRLFGLLLWAGAVAISLSRIAVGAHWPSDVLVGAGLGLALGIAVNRWAWSSNIGVRLGLAMRSRAGSRVVASAIVVLSACMWVAERDYPLAGWMYSALSALGLLAACGWWRIHPGHGERRAAPPEPHRAAP